MDNGASIESHREDFPALRGLRNGRPPIYFDNACTTLVPRQVIDAMDQYYNSFPSCSGTRSRHWFSNEVSCQIDGDVARGVDGSRRAIARHVNARSEKEIIFTSNTSHGINIVALGFSFKPGDVVLLTDKEHNSNLLPWLRLRRQGLVDIRFVGSTPDGELDLDQLGREMRSGKVRLVSMAYTSNLTGYTIPAREVISVAHSYGASVLLDAAQTVPHMPVDVQALDVDLMAFSIHKMCGPKGVGILYGKASLLSAEARESGTGASIESTIVGGGTVSDSTYSSYSLLDPPDRFEVGVQNYAGQIGAGAAVRYLQGIGMERVQSHEARLGAWLSAQLLGRFGEEGWLRILGPRDPALRGGILTFEVKRPNAVGISEELDGKANIMIRDGAFCVHSYLNKEFGEGWVQPRPPSEHRMTYRASLYFYNTLAECQTFVDALGEVFEERGYL
jgi:cysteine desulfurase / selenocysteine lyase